jgi:8-amino-7-oxononanoate synthase
VWQRSRQLGRLVGVPVQSPIVPLLVGPERAALQISAELMQMGFHVPAIRPPTVPVGSSR